MSASGPISDFQDPATGDPPQASPGAARLPSLGERLFSNVFWAAGNEGVGKGLFFLANVILARRLGVEGFGLFTLAQTVALNVWLVADLGTNLYGIREIARDPGGRPHTFRSLLALRVLASGVLFVVYTTAVLVMPLDPGTRAAVLAGGVYLLTYAAFSDWALKGIEEFRLATVANLTASSTFLVLVLTVVAGADGPGAHGPRDAALAWSGCYAAGAVVTLLLLARRGMPALGASVSGDLRSLVHDMVHHVRESIYFAISGALTVTFQAAPVFLTAAFLTNREVGLLGAPMKVWALVLTGGFVIPAAFYPVLSSLHDRDPGRFRPTHWKLVWIMAGFGALVAGVGFLVAGPLVSLVFGPGYEGSVPLMRLLFLAVPFGFLRYAFGNGLLAGGGQRTHNVGSFIGLSAVVVAGLLMVPRWQAAGAAGSLVLGELVLASAMAVLFLRRSDRDARRA